MSDTFQCNACFRLASNMGSGIRMVQGEHKRVCAGCANVLPRGERKKKAPPKRNDEFTTGRYGVPIGTPDYIGHDTRFQCSPEEIAQIKKTGYYSAQWRQLRSGK